MCRLNGRITTLSITGLDAVLVDRVFTHDTTRPLDVERRAGQHGSDISQTDDANHNRRRPPIIYVIDAYLHHRQAPQLLS